VAKRQCSFVETFVESALHESLEHPGMLLRVENEQTS